MREPLSAELKVASFLKFAEGSSYSSVATQLGIGAIAVGFPTREVFRKICEWHGGRVKLPRSEEGIARVMKGLKNVRGMPHCVGAADGAHIL